MVALVAVLLLCGFVLLVMDFVQGFVVDARASAAVAGAGLGICALLLVGFFALYL